MTSLFRTTGSGHSGWRKLAGGIHPADYKQHSLRSVIMDTPLASRLFLPLLQHQGDPARPRVSVGDSVLKGQLLADTGAQPGVPVHSPTSGTVVAIEDHPYPDEFASRKPCIVVQPDGLDAWSERTPCDDWSALSSEEIIRRLQQAGVCGLGGAGFPTFRKLQTGKHINLVIINAAECEPYITADQALLREYAAEVISGARILQHASGAGRCVIATERNKSDAIKALQKALSNLQPGESPELVLLPPRYPLGSEQQLVEAVTGWQIPSGGRPFDLHTLVFNTGTAAAVHDAIVLGQPLISRITTLCGGALKTPKNFRVPLGTPISFLLSLCGVETHRLERLVIGGSMMGFTLEHPEAPVIKTTNCVIAGTCEEFPAQPEPRACIRCDYCSAVCPATLMPQLLYQSLRAERYDLAQAQGLADCIECGACSYVCPSHIPLVQFYRAGKYELVLQKQEQARSAYRKERFEARRERLARDAAQRRGSRRRSIARPENPDVTDNSLQTFSRAKARLDIADAVARVKARKQKQSPTNDPSSDGDNA